MVVVAVVWFNWRNEKEKYLSTKIKRPKTRWPYKVYLQNCGVFPTGKITEWYTWSSQQWDATAEETIKLRQLTSIGEEKRQLSIIMTAFKNTEREKMPLRNPQGSCRNVNLPKRRKFQWLHSGPWTKLSSLNKCNYSQNRSSVPLTSGLISLLLQIWFQ